MVGNGEPAPGTESSASAPDLVGLYSSILVVATTVVTFSLAIIAVPNSGAGCRQDCFDYPYLNTLSQFPRDYLWMPSAMLLVVVYVALVASVHTYAGSQRKVYSLVGLSFALISSGVLLGNYFVQFSVVPVSLSNGETEGIPLLTQYNPHGIFIVLEELGYLLMALSFPFLAAALAGTGRLQRSVRWVFVSGFVLAIGSFAAISAGYGLERLDRFEVAIISIDWLVLVVNGALLAFVFGRRLRSGASGG